MKFLLLSSLLVALSFAQDCFFCASPDLQDSWEVTSLPLKPEKLTFTDKCDTQPTADLKTACPSGVCYEAIIPLNNKAQYLRGCYADFYNEETNYTQTKLKDAPICKYGQVKNEKWTDHSVTPLLTTDAMAANRWCATGTGSNRCNIVLKYEDLMYSDANTFFGDNKCVIDTEHACLECSRFGNDGECNPDSTAKPCRGAQCVKYDGFLNGEVVSVRTCAPTSPYSQDQCVWIDSYNNFELFGITLKMPYKANHCFCSGESCNPSSTLSSSLAVSLLLPLALCRLLPF